MRYEGDIYRPPSEAMSYLLQVTIGCAHNKCTFCTMFKDKQFRVRNMDEIMEDLEMARKTYAYVRRIFLCDGDALCLANNKLMKILNKIKELFPECERVGIYGSTKDVLRKSPEELRELVDNGLSIVYLGAESGSDRILEMIKKDVTSEDICRAVQRAEAAGMKTSVTFISGIGGVELWEEHALKTGELISKMNASYVSLLTLMLDRRAPIYEDMVKGSFTLLSPTQIVAETYLMIKNANPAKSCVFRSNHASNYISLRGNLPEDKERMLSGLKRAMEDSGLLKDERFRRL